MKVTIVSGDDTEKSRKRFGDIVKVVKKRGWQVNWHDKSSTGSLVELLQPGSLFDTPRVTVCPDMKNVLKSEISCIAKNFDTPDSNLLLYNKGKLSQSLRSAFKGANIEEFAVPFVVYKFFDALYPGNTKGALRLYAKVSESENAEFITAMLGRYLRDLAWAGESPPPKYPEWRLTKLKAQLQLLGSSRLQKMIGRLAEHDLAVKTGKPADMNFFLVQALSKADVT